MDKEQKDRLKAARSAFRQRRKKMEQEKRGAKAKRKPEEVYSVLREREEVAKRMRRDQTVDVGTLRRLSEKPEPRTDGRRGKNLFRAYLWIGR